MAVNVNVYDLQDNPDNNKTVTIDIKQVTPIGYEGDEQWVVSATTTAYSSIASRTAISDIYILEMKGGWAKSSGLVTSPFTINANRKLRLRMDADIASGTDPKVQSGYWEVTLAATTSGTATGDDIASDLETQIRALADNADMDATYTLSYMNASVEFSEDKFKIIAGSIADSYTGGDRSAVDVYTGSSWLVDPTSCTATLGFDLGTDTVALSDLGVKEVAVATTYSGGTDLVVDSGLGSVSVGDAFYIANNTGQEEYFIADTASTETTIKVLTTDGNVLRMPDVATYPADTSKVQRISWNDPDALPTNYYSDVDAGVRWAVKSLANQIDYTS